MKNENILIVDFGGQYKELIARRARECGVYCEICLSCVTADEVRDEAPIGIIFSGGPNSVYDKDAPKLDPEIFKLGIPILGICYGMQLMCHTLSGTVSSCDKSEYGKSKTVVDTSSPIFYGLDEEQITLMSHTDRVTEMPEGFVNIAHTDSCEVAAFSNEERSLYGVQFHPEVESTPNGTEILENFLFRVCKASGDYSMDDYLEEQVAAVREQVGNNKVILGLSGGVDSSVCAMILSKAIPGQLTCVYVDHGFMRKGESEEVRKAFLGSNLDFIQVDASERFYNKLKGVSDPQLKRKIIGAEFARVFEDVSKNYEGRAFLAQGTIYPDIVESGGNGSAIIKWHHNSGGLPDNLDMEGVVEPLRGLFKDEVRKLGYMLGLPKRMIERPPFPGPGLAIRIIGAVTKKKLEILREADAIFREEVLKGRVSSDQYFAVLTNTRSVGVMGDFRTYDYTLALRAVSTSDFMTCEYVRMPYALLTRASSRITNEVKGINRVVYDITSKPPATIEWE